ncbi:protein translocase subunit SecF [Serpentinicella sp. ANB-PHB4]|uniref:protein translocase subunit SecF n=1 Tax=Serpentinicella sp. ANB-PHB4 TaxID=3074076 RepID=UPI00285E0C8C|nr:protein translocase subunit SecF [Serpentinicella sp. ANB-PHB4]MDR5658066.1 protein translocase subunit SecF [Serpentinicella sp. ANB-PHB4]
MKIIENRKIWFTISSIIIVLGLVMTALFGMNVGIDFSGGTELQIEFDQPVEIDEIRQVTDNFDPNANINFIGPERTIVQIQTVDNLDSEARQEVFNDFKEQYEHLDQAKDFNADFIGPRVGREIRNRALLAMLISAIGMLLYISYRFELRFGLAAIAALIHDLLVVLAIYAIFRIPLNISFVAAMLTVLGYSINDTIVVFDRIRENTRFIKKSNYEEIANNSISQTITRSINTSITTLLTIGALFIIAPQIRELTLPLIAGVLSGTYSSIFIASPVWVMLKERQKQKKTGYTPKN